MLRNLKYGAVASVLLLGAAPAVWAASPTNPAESRGAAENQAMNGRSGDLTKRIEQYRPSHENTAATENNQPSRVANQQQNRGGSLTQRMERYRVRSATDQRSNTKAGTLTQRLESYGSSTPPAGNGAQRNAAGK